MTRFLIAFLASTLLCLAGIALLPLTRLASPGAEVAWAASLYRDKDQMAAQAGANRILAVGGSGTLFSLDTQTLSRRMGLPVINYGSHAGLGLAYILDRAARNLRAGDVVLLTPEHELLQEGGAPNQLAISFATFYDRDYVMAQPLKQRLSYLLGYGAIPALTEGVKTLARGPAGGRADIHLDVLGNARGNTVEAGRKITLTVAPPVEPPRPVSADARAALARFAAAARAKKIRVIALPPALLDDPGYASPTYRAFGEEEKRLFAQLGMDTLGEFKDGLLPPQEMYDSAYHANDLGRARYTARIAELICGRLVCTP
jgi:hypothetical protein